MSSTLSKIMNEATTPPPPPPPVIPGPWYTSITLWIVVFALACVFAYIFHLLGADIPNDMPSEEEVKESVDGDIEKSIKRVINDELEEKEAQALEESGFCYIGKDRGIRSCIRVNPGDRCMSGQIFPRNDICVNPTLRL